MLFCILGCYPSNETSLVDASSITSLRDVECNYQSVLITQNWTVEGFITANDEYGEFYNCVIIEDESAALKLMCEVEDNYKLYPIGSFVRLNCSGLYLRNSYGSITLGGEPTDDYTLGMISQSRIGQYLEVVESTSGESLEPKGFTIGDLTPLSAYSFVRLSDVWISNQDSVANFCSRDSLTGFTQSTSHWIIDAAADSMELYVNRLCSYADAPLPDTQVSIGVIVEYYNGEYSATITNYNIE